MCSQAVLLSPFSLLLLFGPRRRALLCLIMRQFIVFSSETTSSGVGGRSDKKPRLSRLREKLSQFSLKKNTTGSSAEADSAQQETGSKNDSLFQFVSLNVTEHGNGIVCAVEKVRLSS